MPLGLRQRRRLDGIDRCEPTPPFAPVDEFGCTDDRDGDGFLDDVDRCPDDNAPNRPDGCTDFDEDGVPDEVDECVFDPGPASADGFPDEDGDTVPDRRDDCPVDHGGGTVNGCPDADGDGIADFADFCPADPGTAEANGCPWSLMLNDQDGDGVPFASDDCPTRSGPASFGGCPERFRGDIQQCFAVENLSDGSVTIRCRRVYYDRPRPLDRCGSDDDRPRPIRDFIIAEVEPICGTRWVAVEREGYIVAMVKG